MTQAAERQRHVVVLHFYEDMSLATVTDADAPSDNVIRLVTASVPSAPRRRWAWLAAAAAAGVVAGAGLMAVADRDTDRADVPAASTTPVAVDLFGLANRCRAAHAEVRATGPDEAFAELPALPAVEGATVLLFGPTDNDPQRTALVANRVAFYTCSITNEGRAQIDDNDTFGVQAQSPVLSTDVRVLEVRMSTSGLDLDVGPGRIIVIGRAGTAVSALELEVTDGFSSRAELRGGWFIADVDVPSGVSVSDQRVVWETTAGESLSARLDLLDQSTAYEECAMQPGCVESRLEQLRDESVASGRNEHTAILEDLEVTAEERSQAHERFAACFNAADTGATATVHQNGGIAIGTANLDDASAQQRMDSVWALCGAAHTDLVDEAYALLDAQRRVAEG